MGPPGMGHPGASAAGDKWWFFALDSTISPCLPLSTERPLLSSSFENISVGLDLAIAWAFRLKAREGGKRPGFMELASLNDPQILNLQNASLHTAQTFTRLNQSCFFSVYWRDLGCCSLLSKRVAVSTVNWLDLSLLESVFCCCRQCKDSGH